MDPEEIALLKASGRSYALGTQNRTTSTNDHTLDRRASIITLDSPNYYYDQEDNDYYSYNNGSDLKPTPSLSTPLNSPYSESHHKNTNTTSIDASERMQFLREMQQAREELSLFRENMAGLAKQMDGIALDLEKSKDRVSEIEQDLTATEEVNVNLQVLLEKAVKTQKESDVFATHAIRNMYSDLASVVYENNQLQGRLVSIEHHQKEQKGSVQDMVKRIHEYTQMLEQAQGTIHMLQEPRMIKTSLSTTSWSRRTSIGSASQLYTTDDDDASVSSYRKESHITSRQPPPISPSPQFNTNRRTSYIQSPPLGPSHSPGVKPQQGLRMLFDSHGNRGGIGLGSLAKK